MNARAQIFLSYAREDEEKVENLYQELSDAGFKPWMDKKDILPGERWETSIRRAIRRSDFFLACLSANSATKRGVLQKEIKDALDIWQEMLDSDIYLIPVRLEDCEVPESLSDFQWVNLFEENGWTRLVEAIQVGMERRAVELRPITASPDISRQKEEPVLTTPDVVDPGLHAIWQQRLRDLADNIAQDLVQLKEYEDKLRYEYDLSRRAGHRREIKRLRESAAGYHRDHDELRSRVIGEPPAALQGVDTQLQYMGAKLDTLRKAPIVKLPPLVTLLFNLVVVVVLARILAPPVSVSLPCVSPLASASSLAVILLLLFQSVWRYLGPAIREVSDSVEVGPLTVPISVLTALADALHLWILSDLALWVLAIVLSLAVGLVGLSPFSPFPIHESPPIIQNFLVHYADNHTETFAAGDLVEIPAYTQALVKAVVSGQADVLCTWPVVKGTQLPAEGCATLYSPPLEGNRDALSVLAQSPCKTWQAFAGLHIKVVQVEP